VKAVVLAAGKGTRLGSVTAMLPKPLLPVRGRPVIGLVLDLLARNGVGEVFMNLHHHPDALRDYCGDGARWVCGSPTRWSGSSWERRGR